MPDARSLVSVVTPCHVTDDRQLALLDETLATVGVQTHPHYEILVVDDGSPHPSVADVVARHAHARAIRQPNAGPAAARNRAIAEARGEYLVFLDADDHLSPHALAAAMDAFAAHPASAMVVGPRDDMAFDGTPLGWEWQPPLDDPDLYRTLLRFDWYIIPPSSVTVRRAVATALGGFRDPWGADDLDFYLRVVRQHPVACFGGAPVTRYRRYPESSSRDGARMLRSIRAVYTAEWPFVAGDAAREEAFHTGLARLVEIFQRALVENVELRLERGDRDGALRAARLLADENPALARAALPGAVRHLVVAGTTPSAGGAIPPA